MTPIPLLSNQITTLILKVTTFTLNTSTFICLEAPGTSIHKEDILLEFDQDIPLFESEAVQQAETVVVVSTIFIIPIKLIMSYF